MRRKNKYRNKKTIVDGITFDSKAEARYYKHLKFLEKAKEIQGFDRQVKIELVPGFNHPRRKIKSGKPSRVSAINYIVDFVVYDKDGKKHYVDVKGKRTSEFNIKAKLFMKKTGEPLVLARAKGSGWDHEDA